MSNPQDVSLLPVRFTTEPEARFNAVNRVWQSAPGAAVSAGGRIFVVCSGDNTIPDEKTTNYTVCAYSDDGEHFELCFYAWHDCEVRVSETLLYRMPDGSICHFWTQSYRYFDGRGGIWCARCANPDAVFPRFDEPRRICDGFMAHTPTLLRSGRLMFPASVWTHMESEWHPLPQQERPSVWIGSRSLDDLSYVGGSYDDTPDYTENAVFEKKDGTLAMLWRSKSNGIVRADSHDGGKTWSEKKEFLFKGPTSRFYLDRFPSGNLLLVTHTHTDRRNNLTALLSLDEGESFPYSLLLDERDCSYPSGNVDPNGRVTLAYDRGRTEEREILLASFDENDIINGTFGKNSYTQKIVFKGGVKGI